MYYSFFTTIKKTKDNLESKFQIKNMKCYFVEVSFYGCKHYEFLYENVNMKIGMLKGKG